jgi:hypothetical protein
VIRGAYLLRRPEVKVERLNNRVVIAVLAAVGGVAFATAGLANAAVKVPPGGGYSITFMEGNGSGTSCTHTGSDGSTTTYPPGTTATVTTYNSDGSVASTSTYTCDGSDGNWVSSAAPGGSSGLRGPVLGAGAVAIGPPSSIAITVCSPSPVIVVYSSSGCTPIINPWPPSPPTSIP